MVGYDEKELKSHKELKRRIDNIYQIRTNSTRPGTQALASTPYLFGEIRQPETDFILIPRVSSENRTLVPMSIFDSKILLEILAWLFQLQVYTILEFYNLKCTWLG